MGNYELAAKLAGERGDTELAAIAILMCGAVGRGLAQLEACTFRYPESRLYAAYGNWCCDRRAAALAHLDAIADIDFAEPARRLRAWIDRDSIAIAVIADINNARGAPLHPGSPFAVRRIASDLAQTGSADDLQGALAGHDLLVVYDSASNAVMAEARKAGIPVAMASADFDQRLAELHRVLGQADVILGGTALEHHILSNLFDTRVVSFPGLPYREPRTLVMQPRVRDLDIFCSGVSFAPYWPDKARLLYGLAALDDPDLKIVICDGYIDEALYRDRMMRAKFVPLVNRLEFSVHQDRSTEVLQYGTDGLAVGGVDATWLLGAAGRHIHAIDPGALNTIVPDMIRRYLPDPDRMRDAETLADFYPAPPLRDTRTLKFALFQTLFASRRADCAPAPEAVSACGAEAFARFMNSPLNPGVQEELIAAMEADCRARPNAVMPPFNKARSLWLIGRRVEAVDLFRRVAAMPVEPGGFDLSDTALPHRMKALSALLPYQTFYQGVICDRMDRDAAYPRARAVIAATCLTYLALDASQNERFDEGANLAGQALALCSRHHPAAAQLAKASFAAGHPPQQILKGYLAASELYPPLIDELLPIGVDAMERLGYGDLALAHVRRWLFAVSRIAYCGAEAPAIPRQTADFALRYADRLPAALQRTLAPLYSGGDARPRVG